MVSLHDDCREILEQVEFYLDGELDAAARLAIHHHLEMCGPCMDHSEFQRHLKELLKAKCGCDRVPADLLERIRTALPEPSA